MSSEYLLAFNSDVASKSKTIIIQSTPEKVFAHMDDLSNTGMHKEKRSGMMMGSKLKLQQISENKSGLFSKYRWHGRMLGIPLDFSTVVTQWIRGKEKVWQTIGDSKMIILKWYRMHLVITPLENERVQIELSIDYTLPNNFFLHFTGLLLAPWYANWCLNKMLSDTKKILDPLSF